MKRYVYIPLLLGIAACAGSRKVKAPAAPAAATPPAAIPGKNGIKPYAGVITPGMVTRPGLFTVHHTPEMDTVYFEVADSLLGRDILVTNSVHRIVGDLKTFAGEELTNTAIEVEKGPNETLLLRGRYQVAQADSDQVISRAVTLSNTRPVLATLPIRAYGKDSASYVVDMTPLFKDNNNFVNSIGSLTMSGLQDNEVLSVHSYPQNVAVTITRNGTASKPPKTLTLAASSKDIPASLETTTSFVLLPKVPMQQRFADPRIGYFSDKLLEYSDDQQEVKERAFITRWRMEPRPEDLEKYRRGELVEPANPIVFYLDPATPQKWRPYLIQGVLDWQPAFEQAGFKNAITAKEWPEDDSTMDMDDIRHSLILYLPATDGNAMGNNIHDPRSGEIIQARVSWYHNIQDLLHNWYMFMAAAGDPAGRAAVFSDTLMGRLIRTVSSHEIGHTLGLAHNFGSSSTVPVDSLRSVAFLRRYGHTPSIMDYARFNFVAQPEDSVPQALLFPRVNDYDRWAIQWGYKITGAATPAADHKLMARLLSDSLEANHRLWFADGESYKFDPRTQPEDLGDDNIKAAAMGIRNMKRVMLHLSEWNQRAGGQHERLFTEYNQLMGYYYGFLQQVGLNTCASYRTLRIGGDERPEFVPVGRARQIEALEFANNELFNNATWCVDTAALNKFMLPFTVDFLESMQTSAVNVLLHPLKLEAIMAFNQRYGNDKTLSVEEVLGYVRKGIWTGVDQSSIRIDAYHRNMQKCYVNVLLSNITGPKKDELVMDVTGVSTAELKIITAMVRKALPSAGDYETKAHLAYLQERIARLSTLHVVPPKNSAR